MLVALAMAMSVSSEIASMRAALSQTAWQICVNRQTDKSLEQAPSIGRDGAVMVAMESCFVFGEDYKRTLPDIVIYMLKEKGIKNAEQPSIVSMLVDESFKTAKEQVETTAKTGESDKAN